MCRRTRKRYSSQKVDNKVGDTSVAGMNNLCHVFEHSVDGLDNPQSLIRSGTDFIPLLGRCFVVSLPRSGLRRELMKNNALALDKAKS